MSRIIQGGRQDPNALRSAAMLVILIITPSLRASTTTAWEMNMYQDFVRGRFQGVSLSRDGRLMLAPKLETLFSSDQPVIWSVAEAPDGSVYVGTGHRGRLYRIDKSGKSTLVWSAEQPEIFAVAVDARGGVYAATSPDGKVYRVEQGKASEYFAPQAKYIWTLAVAPDGALYVGTGDQGRIFRVESAGKGELYYATGQAHVTGLALDRQGRLLAGTEPNGILYRVSAKDKAFVLYDANLPEIRAISAAPDGAIYAVAMGGSLGKQMQGVPQPLQNQSGAPVATATGTSISVTAESAQSGTEIKPPAEQPKPAPAPQAQPVVAQFTPTMDVSGVEKSAVYKINPDNTVETLWTSKEENVYDLLALKGQLLFSTDSNGRIYRLSQDHKLTLVVQTNEAEATRLVPLGDSVLAATANMGRLYKLGDMLESSGSFESPVHDAGTVAQWGRVSWRVDDAGAGSISLRTRTGNSLRPDKTWSDWSEPLAAAEGTRIPSPNARYIQWKADFSGYQGKTPVLEGVSVAYLPQNNAPVLRSISITNQLSLGGAAARPASQPAPAVYSITVTDTGDAAPAISTGTPTQTPTRAGQQQINIGWQAEDPDGDRLVYSLWFRGEGEREWKLLKANIHENTLAVDGDAFADGKYLFRVVASDREANPPASARETELVSSPVLIDNTPPVVTPGTPKKSAGVVEIEFEAADAASPLRHGEYSVDAGSWIPVESVDGVVDSLREKFVVRLQNISPGEHVVVFRAVDSANNAGLAKVILR